ncbi:hypothetical protein AVDCRST_MAG82-801, partial [uncultured Rubrobacteraceae bacterium]
EQRPRRAGGGRGGAPGGLRHRRAPAGLGAAQVPSHNGGRVVRLRGRGYVGGLLRRSGRQARERGDDHGGLPDRPGQERDRRRPQDGPRRGLQRRRHPRRQGRRNRKPPRPLRRHRGPEPGPGSVWQFTRL